MEIRSRRVSIFYCRNHNFKFPRTQIYYCGQDLMLRRGWKKSLLFAVFKEIFSVTIFSMKFLWIGIEKWPIATLGGLRGPWLYFENFRWIQKKLGYLIILCYREPPFKRYSQFSNFFSKFNRKSIIIPFDRIFYEKLVNVKFRLKSNFFDSEKLLMFLTWLNWSVKL